MCVTAIVAALVAPAPTPVQGIVAAMVIATLLFGLNKGFFLTHSTSPLCAGVFMLLEGACPGAIWPGWQGAALALVTLGCAGMLFWNFQRAAVCTRTIFLIFLLIGTGALFFSAFVVMIPVLFIGAVQLKAMSMRGFVAMLLGIVTGPWLLVGSGLVPLESVAFLQNPHLFALPEGMAQFHLAVSAGGAALACVIFGGACFLTYYGYQSKVRACNSFLYLLTAVAMLLPVVDFDSAEQYLPLLNLCAAYHVAHFATSRPRGWSGVAVVMLGCAGLYFWNCTL